MPISAFVRPEATNLIFGYSHCVRRSHVAQPENFSLMKHNITDDQRSRHPHKIQDLIRLKINLNYSVLNYSRYILN
ncbi:hypothetical protein [Chroococcidiopsis sp. TS-821]|uniref:hypothetical protein n=1 Tax=Chroococcidiopsis sp. TS-821 TaxID=1378066 RepID=UPI0011B0D6BC|nr:hypothetical protein [Chroococcidiopsis sp. TS-821]